VTNEDPAAGLVAVDLQMLTDMPRTIAPRFEQLAHIFLAVEPQGSPFHARRTWRHIAADPQETLLLAFLDKGRARVDQNGREAYLVEGDFVLLDATRPYTIDVPDAFTNRTFQFPKSVLGLADTDLSRLTGAPLRQNHALSAFLIPFLGRLSGQGSRLHPRVRDQLVGNVTDILATLIGDSLRDMPLEDAARRTLVLRVKTFIQENLDDPGLSPELIAVAHNISVRYLHKIFTSEDTTVSRWILRARLERARKLLTRRDPYAVTVTDAAFASGFVSPAHFSRAFRDAYDMTPREWRQAAQEQAR
jgi:AraC-like DNA-binding protein